MIRGFDYKKGTCGLVYWQHSYAQDTKVFIVTTLI